MYKENSFSFGVNLTRMSPFSSSPGSMVMQMLVLLSPCTLLWLKMEKKNMKSNLRWNDQHLLMTTVMHVLYS